jgi:hypothetical protein
MKPCPFCGASASVELVRDGSLYAATCTALGCVASNFQCAYSDQDDGDAKARAIAAWNTRVSDQRIAALEAALHELMGKLKPYLYEEINPNFPNVAGMPPVSKCMVDCDRLRPSYLRARAALEQQNSGGER